VDLAHISRLFLPESNNGHFHVRKNDTLRQITNHVVGRWPQAKLLHGCRSDEILLRIICIVSSRLTHLSVVRVQTATSIRNAMPSALLEEAK
jgi:hypothetical protein